MASGDDVMGDRLHQYLDAMAADLPVETDRLDPTLEATVRRFHALGAVPTPRRSFVEQLEKELTGIARTVNSQPDHPDVWSPPAGRVSNAPVDLLSRGRARTTRHHRPWANLATAVLILLTLATGFAAYRLRTPASQTNPPGQIAAVAATPGFTIAVASPEECRIAPRSPLSVRQILATPPAPVTPLAASSDIAGYLTGAPADKVTATQIAATLREMQACAMAEDSPRYLAFYSDDYIRRLVADRGQPIQDFLDSMAQGPENPSVFRDQLVRSLRVLPDGRVAAILTIVPAAVNNAPPPRGAAPRLRIRRQPLAGR